MLIEHLYMSCAEAADALAPRAEDLKPEESLVSDVSLP